MVTRSLGNLGDKVSLLGMGCMRLPRLEEDKQDIDKAHAQKMVDYALASGVNYFDTAWPYHEGLSEPFVGEALSGYRRESFFLATKLPMWLVGSREEAEEYFSKQLERCKVEYFDYYLLHSMCEAYFEKMVQFNLYDFILEKQAEGKIRHIGFSFHDKPEMLEKIIDGYAWDFAQIQLNYMDWELQDARRQYGMLEKAGIPVIIMEPIRGGALATLSDSAVGILKAHDPVASPASWALRYAASLPGVLTVLSGMSSLHQVMDNVSTFQSFQPLTDMERTVLDKALAAYRASSTIPCTGCRYCMDCPAGVDIPKVFEAYNQYNLTENAFGFQRTYELLGEEHQAQHCVDCKQCVELCPQHIDIPAGMEKVRKLAETLEKA